MYGMYGIANITPPRGVVQGDKFRKRELCLFFFLFLIGSEQELNIALEYVWRWGRMGYVWAMNVVDRQSWLSKQRK